MGTNDLSNTLEALLFAAGESITLERLAKLAKAPAADVRTALDTLARRLTYGITLVRTAMTAQLAVAPGLEEPIQNLLGDPEEREIGQAGLEVLAIILYQGPSTRAQIDYIRGVNSTSSIRTLLMRGLIERAKGDGRESVYHTTVNALMHLGVAKIDELPRQSELRESLKQFIARAHAIDEIKT